MSFMERRISEYKTAPDTTSHHHHHRRVRFSVGTSSSSGGDKIRRSSSPLIRGPGTTKSSSSSNLLKSTPPSLIPVIERKKMFEQTDSAIPSPPAPSLSSGFGSVSGRRGSKPRKEISRNTSFRGTKRLKGEEAGSPILGRARSSNAGQPLWKKLRNFGHFDLQSLTIDSMSVSS